MIFLADIVPGLPAPAAPVFPTSLQLRVFGKCPLHRPLFADRPRTPPPIFSPGRSGTPRGAKQIRVSSTLRAARARSSVFVRLDGDLFFQGFAESLQHAAIEFPGFRTRIFSKPDLVGRRNRAHRAKTSSIVNSRPFLTSASMVFARLISLASSWSARISSVAAMDSRSRISSSK